MRSIRRPGRLPSLEEHPGPQPDATGPPQAELRHAERRLAALNAERIRVADSAAAHREHLGPTQSPPTRTCDPRRTRGHQQRPRMLRMLTELVDPRRLDDDTTRVIVGAINVATGLMEYFRSSQPAASPSNT